MCPPTQLRCSWSVQESGQVASLGPRPKTATAPLGPRTGLPSPWGHRGSGPPLGLHIWGETQLDHLICAL